MIKIKPEKILFFLFLILITGCEKKTANVVSSPNQKISLEAILEEGNLFYTVSRNQQTVINKSRLGFVLKEGNFDRNFKVEHVEHSSFNETWEQPWGEEISVVNNYNEMTVNLIEANATQRKLKVVFRVFNDGIGFRYEFPEQENMKNFVIMDELTEFAIADGGTSWSFPAFDGTEYYEALYKASPVSELKTTVATPLTIEVRDDLYLAIHEANLTDYAAMNLTPTDLPNVLKVELTPWSTGEKVFAKAPSVSPWRTVIITDNPGDLILSRLMLNLNDPSRIEDTSWIEPGRYIGIWWGMHMEAYTWYMGPKHGATTTNTKRYIDFAAKHGFSGVLVEGWNKGWENDWTKEGDKFSFTEAYPDYNLSELSKYATERGVRLIGHHETGGATKNYETQLEDAFALCRKMGINSVKTGYVGPLLDGKERHSGQYGVRHYRKVIETAAKYHVMIDNHEPVMPTGLQRTWPNLMTQEGVRGQEYNAWSRDGGNPPDHTVIIPFTRGLAGPIDFTPGIFNYDNPVYPQTRPRTTRAKQLALSVVLFSPLQMAADMIENYEGFPEFEFLMSCPTTWSKTVVPESKIGEYVTFARRDRDSDSWFVGSITNANEREMNLPLSFLKEGITYKAKIFKDAPEAHYNDNPYIITIEEIEVNKDSILKLWQAPGGGTAIIIEPK